MSRYKGEKMKDQQKNNVDIPDILLDGITEKDARELKKRLEENCLTQKWLLRRLKRDFGIEISNSNLSDLFNSRWSVGRNGRRVIFCAMEIITRYESVFEK